MPRHQVHSVNCLYVGHCRSERGHFVVQIGSLNQTWCFDLIVSEGGLEARSRACCPGATRVYGCTVIAVVSCSLVFLFPGRADAFIIRFICNDDVYPGTPRFLHQDIDSGLGIWDTFFEFETALACVPSPVDCQVTGEAGAPGIKRPVKSVCARVSVFVYLPVCVSVCVCVCVHVCLYRMFYFTGSMIYVLHIFFE